MNVNQNIGKKLKMIRIDRDLSQAELGQMIGLSTSRISAMEKGDYRFTIEILDRLGEALQISRSDLLGRPEDETGIYMVISGLEKEKKIKIKEVIKKLQDLPTENLENLLKFLDGFMDNKLK